MGSSTLCGSAESIEFGQVSLDQGLLLGAGPAFKLAFATNGGYLSRMFFAAQELDRQPRPRVRGCLPARVCFKTRLDIVRGTDIEAAVRTLENVDEVHTGSPSYGKSLCAHSRPSRCRELALRRTRLCATPCGVACGSFAQGIRLTSHGARRRQTSSRPAMSKPRAWRGASRMEAAGIEPASRDMSGRVSTCVVRRLISKPQAPTNRLRRFPAQLTPHNVPPSNTRCQPTECRPGPDSRRLRSDGLPYLGSHCQWVIGI